MGKWTHLMIHCADTPSDFDVKPHHIEKWHLKERGWKKVGYSILFERSGKTDILIPFDADDDIDAWEISNGAAGWNGHARHICYAGGKGNIDDRTEGQKYAMEATIKLLLMLQPNIKIIGHNQVNKHKYCPSFNVPKWCINIGIPTKNIDFKNYVGNPYYIAPL